MKPGGDAMVGDGRTIKNGKLVGHEYLRIVKTGADVSYISRPSSNPVDTSFRAIRFDGSEIVFENLAHDFPQRIIYRRQSSNFVFARIEGTMDGKIRAIDFEYSRVKCE